ncbi:hypothetical protein AVEN_184153-1 [Araneus ventricosus]|uniref:Uncharacterized protein n=1 Tax=Araneus ventricosus TaxID=182803 RepID=A0A4Y2FSB3_ARAVE|nr:hypothetical protein AVEN_184153-1 [Araneus ventricosus]
MPVRSHGFIYASEKIVRERFPKTKSCQRHYCLKTRKAGRSPGDKIRFKDRFADLFSENGAGTSGDQNTSVLRIARFRLFETAECFKHRVSRRFKIVRFPILFEHGRQNHASERFHLHFLAVNQPASVGLGKHPRRKSLKTIANTCC